MALFGHQDVTTVVTADDIRKLTGTRAEDYDFKDVDNDEEALDELLEIWIERIASHIHVRTGREILEDDEAYLAVQDILIRTVAKIVAVAQQQRTSPVVRINDFAISVLNTSEVTKDLNKELSPFRKRGVSFFSSLGRFEESEE